MFLKCFLVNMLHYVVTMTKVKNIKLKDNSLYTQQTLRSLVPRGPHMDCSTSKHCNPNTKTGNGLSHDQHSLTAGGGGDKNSCSQAHYELALLGTETDRGGRDFQRQSGDCVLLICHLTPPTECRE